MTDTSLEHLFNAAKLSVSTPENVFTLPTTQPAPNEWLQQLTQIVDRKLAYFDEILSAFLIIRLSSDPPDADGKPPAALVNFLTYLQVALEASYISPAPDHPPAVPEHASTQLLGPPPPGRPGAKPRSGSPLKPRPPPLQPPQTPNPTPQSADSDKQYAVAEGIQLNAFIWGESLNKETRRDEFALIWDEGTKEWVSIYRMDVTIGP
jgi:hypothetical protein